MRVPGRGQRLHKGCRGRRCRRPLCTPSRGRRRYGGLCRRSHVLQASSSQSGPPLIRLGRQTAERPDNYLTGRFQHACFSNNGSFPPGGFPRRRAAPPELKGLVRLSSLIWLNLEMERLGVDQDRCPRPMGCCLLKTRRAHHPWWKSVLRQARPLGRGSQFQLLSGSAGWSD